MPRLIAEHDADQRLVFRQNRRIAFVDQRTNSTTPETPRKPLKKIFGDGSKFTIS
jgi:hypothetical protein